MDLKIIYFIQISQSNQCIKIFEKKYLHTNLVFIFVFVFEVYTLLSSNTTFIYIIYIFLSNEEIITFNDEGSDVQKSCISVNYYFVLFDMNIS